MIHKKFFKTILASAIALILAACLSVTALGISSVGETGSGGGSTGTSTEFAIADDSDEGGIVGNRFSIVDGQLPRSNRRFRRGVFAKRIIKKWAAKGLGFGGSFCSDLYTYIYLE